MGLAVMPRRAEAGFSLIEALIAALITLIIVLGVLPLFARSLRSNLSGAEATAVTNMALARAEEYYQYPFDSAKLTIPGGKTEVTLDEVWTEEDAGWITGTAATATAASKTPLWTRHTRVRQYNVNDVIEGTLTPLDGDADPGTVQLKEIEVAVSGTREAGNVLGGSKPLTVRLFKSQ